MENTGTPSRMQLSRVRGQKTSGAGSQGKPGESPLKKIDFDGDRDMPGLAFGDEMGTTYCGTKYTDGLSSARASGQGEAKLAVLDDAASMCTHDRIKALLKEFEHKVSSIHSELLTGKYSEGDGSPLKMASPLDLGGVADVNDALKDFGDVEAEMNEIMFSVAKTSPEKQPKPRSPEVMEASSLLRLQFEENKSLIERHRMERMQTAEQREQQRQQRERDEELLSEQRRKRAEFLRQQDEIHNHHMAEIMAHQEKLAKQREELQRLSPSVITPTPARSVPRSPESFPSPKAIEVSVSPTQASPPSSRQLTWGAQPGESAADNNGAASPPKAVDAAAVGPSTHSSQQASAVDTQSKVPAEASTEQHEQITQQDAGQGSGAGPTPSSTGNSSSAPKASDQPVQPGEAAQQQQQQLTEEELAAKEADELRKKRNRERAEQLFGPIKGGKPPAQGRGAVRSLDDSAFDKKGASIERLEKKAAAANECDFEGEDDFVSELVGPGWVKSSAPVKGCLASKKKGAKSKKAGFAASPDGGDIMDDIPKAPEPPKDRKSIIGCWLAPVVEALDPNTQTPYSLTYVQTPQGILVNSPGGWVPPDVHPFVQEQRHIMNLVKEHPHLSSKPAEVVKAAALVAELGMEPLVQDPAEFAPTAGENSVQGKDKEGEDNHEGGRSLRFAEGTATEDGNSAKALSDRKSKGQEQQQAAQEEYQRQVEHFQKLPIEQQQMMQLQWQMQQLHMQAAARQQMGLAPSEEMIAMQQRIVQTYNALQAKVVAQQQQQQQQGGGGGLGVVSEDNILEEEEEEVEDDDDIIEGSDSPANKNQGSPGPANAKSPTALRAEDDRRAVAQNTGGHDANVPSQLSMPEDDDLQRRHSNSSPQRSPGTFISGSPPLRSTSGRAGSPQLRAQAQGQQYLGQQGQQYPGAQNNSVGRLTSNISSIEVFAMAGYTVATDKDKDVSRSASGNTGRASPPLASSSSSKAMNGLTAAPNQALGVSPVVNGQPKLAANGQQPQFSVNGQPQIVMNGQQPQVAINGQPQVGANGQQPQLVNGAWELNRANQAVLGQLQKQQMDEMARLKMQMKSSEASAGAEFQLGTNAVENDALLKRQQEEILKATYELEKLQLDLMQKQRELSELSGAVNQQQAALKQQPQQAAAAAAPQGHAAPQPVLARQLQAPTGAGQQVRVQVAQQDNNKVVVGAGGQQQMAQQQGQQMATWGEAQMQAVLQQGLAQVQAMQQQALGGMQVVQQKIQGVVGGQQFAQPQAARQLQDERGNSQIPSIPIGAVQTVSLQPGIPAGASMGVQQSTTMQPGMPIRARSFDGQILQPQISARGLPPQPGLVQAGMNQRPAGVVVQALQSNVQGNVVMQQKVQQAGLVPQQGMVQHQGMVLEVAQGGMNGMSVSGGMVPRSRGFGAIPQQQPITLTTQFINHKAPPKWM